MHERLRGNNFHQPISIFLCSPIPTFFIPISRSFAKPATVVHHCWLPAAPHFRISPSTADHLKCHVWLTLLSPGPIRDGDNPDAYAQHQR